MIHKRLPRDRGDELIVYLVAGSILPVIESFILYYCSERWRWPAFE